VPTRGSATKAARTPRRAPAAPRPSGRDLAFLLEASEDLARSLELPDVIESVSRRLLEVVPAWRVGMLLVEPGRRLRVAASFVRGTGAPAVPRGRMLELDNYPEVEQAMTTRQSVLVKDVRADGVVVGVRGTLDGLGVRSLFIAPLVVQRECLGVLSLAQRRGDKPWTERQRSLAQALANQAAVALRNAQLFERMQASQRELERTVDERTRRLRESHLRLSVLNEITAAINMSLDIERILEEALAGLERLEGVDRAQAVIAMSGPAEVDAFQLGRDGRLESTRRPLPAGEPGDALLRFEGQPVRFRDEELVARAHLSAPLVSKDGVVGILQVFSDSLQPPGDADLELLQQVAGEISIALERSKLYRAEKRRSRQFEAISDIGRQITGAVTLENFLPTSAHLVRSAFGYPLASILLLDDERRELRVVGASAINPRVAERASRHRQPAHLGLCGVALREGRVINVPDASQDPRHVGIEGMATRAELVVPILVAGNAIGVIDVQADVRGAFSDEDVALLRTLADQLAAALQVSRLISDLQRSSAFTEQIINNLTAGLIVTDRRRTVQVVNQRASEILHVKADDLVGRDLLEAFPSASPLFVYSHEAIGRECEVDLADGTRLPLGFSNAFFVDTAQKRDAVIITFRDLSEVRELQRKVRHAERLATIGSVAAGVAHEIRNPLFGISATGQILARELPEASPLRALTNEMLDETRRLNELVTDLVAYGRPQALKLRDLELDRLVLEAVDACRARAEQEHVHLEVHPGGAGRKLQGDGDQLRQVLLNLLLNSIEADPGGRVEVTTAWDAPQGFVLVAVRDHGKGIPPGEIDRVFDLFYTTKPKGSGMGLAISSKIVQDHGGTITASNADDGGALFEVVLPLEHRAELP